MVGNNHRDARVLATIPPGLPKRVARAISSGLMAVLRRLECEFRNKLRIDKEEALSRHERSERITQY